MRILHTGDWHFGRSLEGRSRLEEQTAFVDELVRIVQDEAIDLVLIAGDIYDSVNPPAAAEQLFYEGIARLAEGGKRHVAIISGNHDHPDRLAASGPLAAKQGITLIGLPVADIQSIGIARTGELARLIALPYPSESRLKELLSDVAEEEALRSKYSERVGALIRKQAAAFQTDTVNLIMSHLYVLGGHETESERPIQVGGAYTVDTSALTAGAQYVALGHLHRPQNVKAASPIRYCGSPIAYSFSEAGQAKSVTLLDLTPGQAAEPKEIFLTSGRPLVSWKAKEGIGQVHQWLDERKDATAWIDLEITMTEAMSIEQIQSLRKAYEGFIHIRPIYPEMEAARAAVPKADLSMEEHFTRFYARQTGGAQPEPELVRLFLELLQEKDLADAVGD
ncbi:exonuclease SbcCD subunit D [Paenibacillus alba]|uniref:Nuclease SbcCD subunit D n=1 Tax=Paenibacillus alba TaxID=1197127 RepID=A0ABU6G5B8_9BACL|nr:exonuclease SbcCD subunit D [Paenibacillus alba]MEC0228805.1 exonuclease SbcCD subunit D [Paenibacillus alba]